MILALIIFNDRTFTIFGFIKAELNDLNQFRGCVTRDFLSEAVQRGEHRDELLQLDRRVSTCVSRAATTITTSRLVKQDCQHHDQHIGATGVPTPAHGGCSARILRTPLCMNSNVLFEMFVQQPSTSQPIASCLQSKLTVNTSANRLAYNIYTAYYDLLKTCFGCNVSD